MSEPARLFLAIDLDTVTRSMLAAHVDEHLRPNPPGKPVPPQNWHMTLRFVGRATRVEADRLSFELASLLDGGRFGIRFGGLGAFPKAQRAGVLWLGVRAGADRLGELAGVCDESATAAGFAPEERPFHAHLTLSRIRPARDVRGILAEFPAFDMSMPVVAVTLFVSHLGRGGARYEALERFDLAGESQS